MIISLSGMGGVAPFRLPSGLKSRGYEFEITGTDHWTAAIVAQSMEELKNV